MLCLIKRKILHLASNIENERMNNACTEFEVIIDMLLQLSSSNDHDVGECLNLLELAMPFLNSLENNDSTSENYNFPSNPHGRPKFSIPVEILEFYICNGFKIADVAKILGVSKRTVERRMSENGLSVRSCYSNISDSCLEEEVRNISNQFPTSGYRSILGILRGKGLIVQEERVRRALRIVDQHGVMFRRMFLSTYRIQRRTYNVSSAQALWHIDGYHKLIRWRFVVHGGIDGFSRLPVYLQVNTNNRAETVLANFVEAVNQFGLPNKVRSDKGGENVLVAQYMLDKKGVASRPFIAGRSVHNQRIERFWRELWQGFSVLYYNLFYALEEQNHLDISNEINMKLLHLVFQPRMQIHLNEFCEGIRRRPLRTENNRTPMQLWLGGQQHSTFFEQGQEIDIDNYGIEYNGPSVMETSNDVVVPETSMNFPQHILTDIEHILSKDSDNYGIDVYRELVHYLNKMLTCHE